MNTYSIKSNCGSTHLSKPHFYILNKGMNSGKPLQIPCPNSFVFTSDSENERDFYYWLLFGLWRSKSFHPFLRGSVIPFISIRDLKNCILAGEVEAKANINQFQKNIEILKLLELKEKQFHENLKLIEETRKAIFYKYRRR